MGTVENAIVDDQFRGWLTKMVERGAFVWLIMDACHSGSSIRGSEAEVSRQVPADRLVPQEVLDAVKVRNDVTSGRGSVPLGKRDLQEIQRNFAVQHRRSRRTGRLNRRYKDRHYPFLTKRLVRTVFSILFP